MLAAELHGKIAGLENSEDILTSNVFCMFRYVSDLRIPGQFLRMARNVSGSQLPINELKSASVAFWPPVSLPRYTRIPDALLLLDEQDGTKWAVAIEAKYAAGLSNLNDARTAGSSWGHQLADEYVGLVQGTWGDAGLGDRIRSADRRALVFVTGDHAMPSGDLRESAARCMSLGLAADSYIFWVSWRALYALLTRSPKPLAYDRGDCRYLDDLAELLARRDMREFAGFEPIVRVPPVPKWFAPACPNSHAPGTVP